MPYDGWNIGHVTHLSPDRSSLTIRDGASGQKALFNNAYDTIKQLDLEIKENRKVKFKYNLDRLPYVREIEREERRAPPDHLNKPGNWARGTVAFVNRDRSYLQIKGCTDGKMYYQDEASDTVTRLKLWKRENEAVWFTCCRKEPLQLLDVVACHPEGNPFVDLKG